MAITDAMTPKSPTCPFCHSELVTTTSKSSGAQDVYWRCHTCGQIWNSARLWTVRGRP